ncbi:MAG: hypothetical protein M3Z09_16815 [Acidobacteriota bacterium]|nr:hypothetical protein [Acidobacteriota bacterium]
MNHYLPASLLIAVALVMGQGNSPPAALHLPFGPLVRLTSPDGSHILYGVPYQPGQNQGPQLWIEDTLSHRRTMVQDVSSTLWAAWFYDSTGFLVEDHRSSDSTRTYIYPVGTLQPHDVASGILAADPSAERFAEGHAYFSVDGWQGTQDFLIHLYGHTDKPPVECFDLRFHVSRDGAVQKRSERVWPVTKSFCQE